MPEILHLVAFWLAHHAQASRKDTTNAALVCRAWRRPFMAARWHQLTFSQTDFPSDLDFVSAFDSDTEADGSVESSESIARRFARRLAGGSLANLSARIKHVLQHSEIRHLVRSLHFDPCCGAFVPLVTLPLFRNLASLALPDFQPLVDAGLFATTPTSMNPFSFWRDQLPGLRNLDLRFATDLRYSGEQIASDLLHGAPRLRGLFIEHLRQYDTVIRLARLCPQLLVLELWDSCDEEHPSRRPHPPADIYSPLLEGHIFTNLVDLTIDGPISASIFDILPPTLKLLSFGPLSPRVALAGLTSFLNPNYLPQLVLAPTLMLDFSNEITVDVVRREYELSKQRLPTRRAVKEIRRQAFEVIAARQFENKLGGSDEELRPLHRYFPG